MKRIDYKNIKNGLPYPSIIYGLCLNAGVGGAKHYTTKKCGAPINDKTIERYIVKEPEEEEEDEEEQDEPSLNEPLLCLQPLPGYDPPPKSTLLSVTTISLAGINTPKITCTNKDNMAPRLSKD